MAAKRAGGGVSSSGATRPSWQRSWFFWLLVVLSVATVGVGVWQLLVEHRVVAANSRIAPPVATVKSQTEFSLRGVDGSVVDVSDYRGKVVLLNFWATWCPPCAAEMPDLNFLHLQYGEEHDFTVIAVNVEESRSDVATFAESKELAFPILLDSTGDITNQLYGLRSLPASFIIDRDGSIRDSWTGQIPRAAMLARLQQVW